MAIHKSPRHLRERLHTHTPRYGVRSAGKDEAPRVIHVVPGWATALCGARPGPQPADAEPNCRRCLALLTGE